MRDASEFGSGAGIEVRADTLLETELGVFK